MYKKNNPDENQPSVQPPSQLKFTMEGHEFDPSSDTWTIKGITQSANFKFSNLRKLAAGEIVESAKKTFSWYLQNRSLSHAVNIFERFEHYLKNTEQPVRAVRSIDLINYRSSVLTAQTEWYLGVLSGFFKRWEQLGYSGVEQSALVYFHDTVIAGNRKGESVLTLDPYKGPFTDLELNAINTAVNNGIATGVLSLRDYVITKIFIHFGVRSVQVAALKVCDFSTQKAADGTCYYTLNVPLAKESGIPRESFKPRKVAAKLGKAIAKLIELVWQSYGEYEFADPVRIEKDQLPLIADFGQHCGNGMQHHFTSSKLINECVKSLDRLNIISERTGERIHITTGRFRKTLATRAAEDGHGDFVIAELLHHADRQQVGIYTKLTPKIMAIIDKATAYAYGPIADAFAGKIIKHENQAARGADLTSRIRDPNVGAVGSCGSFDYCDSLAPVACYTCAFFQPWVDAPHDKLLDSLLIERERVADNTMSARIVSISDRTIAAVAEVALKCEKMKGENE